MRYRCKNFCSLNISFTDSATTGFFDVSYDYSQLVLFKNSTAVEVLLYEKVKTIDPNPHVLEQYIP